MFTNVPTTTDNQNKLMAFTSTGGVPHADWFENVSGTVEVLRKELLNDFF